MSALGEAASAEWRRGYQQGEMERIALAATNSELRSENRELRRRLRELQRRPAELEKEVAHDRH